MIDLKLKKIPLLLLLLISYVCSGAVLEDGFILKGDVVIYTSAKPEEPIYKAILALQRDLAKVLGKKSSVKPLTAINAPGIVIINASKNKPFKPIAGWEAHHLYLDHGHQQQQMVLEGADVRGTIYAIYTFSEKILGVPPLWYFCGWTPQMRREISIPASFDLWIKSPQIKYRAWFPNDTDLFSGWRKRSTENDELWLETALRLKLNTMEWFDGDRDYGKKYSVSRTTQLISDYGLINTTHHHSPLNASFAGWDDYWRKTRDTVPPALSLANEPALLEFWRYNAECIVKHHIDMLWVLGFRGNGDHPFWYTFKDAPTEMKGRG